MNEFHLQLFFAWKFEFWTEEYGWRPLRNVSMKLAIKAMALRDKVEKEKIYTLDEVTSVVAGGSIPPNFKRFFGKKEDGQ